MTARGCLRLAIASSCSWQRRISWCRPARSSSARVDRSCCFVSSGTSVRASIRAQGVWARSYTLERSFSLGRNRFTRRWSALYSRFRRSTSSCVSCRSYPTNFRMTELFFFYHMGIVVLVVRTGPCEGDPTGMAETDKVAIHELTAIVGMEGDDPSWIPAEAGLQGSDHIHLCLRPYRSCLGPSRGAVR